jgi:GNAT superfamily N-acetyltransferase
MIRAARPEDVPAIRSLVCGLAAYEGVPDAVQVTEEQLFTALFGEDPVIHAHVAEEQGEEGAEVVALALWFLSFSTWTGRTGIYLEDFFVRPEARRRGHGKALLQELARICVERGYGRLEWSVLNWNEVGLTFYRSVGAVPLDEWTTHRLAGPALAELAGLVRSEPREPDV